MIEKPATAGPATEAICQTELLQVAALGYIFFGTSNDKKEKMGALHPLKRIGTVEDIANIACFLLTDQSSWMTGQVLGVDGGKSTLQTQ